MKELYTGRVYPWEIHAPMGTELATRHLEKLGMDDDDLLSHLNRKGHTLDRPFREGFFKMLPLLFKK